MIEVKEQSGNFLSLSCNGTLTHDDYQKVLIPELEKLIKEHGKARVLFSMGEEFHGWEPQAMWDDAKFGMQHGSDFEKCAVVGGPKWVEWATKIFSTIVACDCKCFGPGELPEASEWIKAP